MLPFLMSETSSSDSLKTLLMFQMMSEGGSMDMGGFLPMLMMSDDDSEMSETMKLVLLSSMVGAGTDENNFNMLLPFALQECPEGDGLAECEEERKDMMVLLNQYLSNIILLFNSDNANDDVVSVSVFPNHSEFDTANVVDAGRRQ